MAYNTVKIKKYSDHIEEFQATAALSPGMLLELVSATTIKKHSLASKNAIPIMFALEDELQGKGITDAYAAGDKVQVWIPWRGDVVYARVADEENIAFGDALVSAGDGTLRKDRRTYESFESADVMGTHEIYPHNIVGYAFEALDLSGLSAAGSSDTPQRMFIKVLIA